MTIELALAVKWLTVCSNLC